VDEKRGVEVEKTPKDETPQGAEKPKKEKKKGGN
jgi:hypothetical protein